MQVVDLGTKQVVAQLLEGVPVPLERQEMCCWRRVGRGRCCGRSEK